MILATISDQLRRYCFRNTDITLEEFLTHAQTTGLPKVPTM